MRRWWWSVDYVGSQKFCPFLLIALLCDVTFGELQIQLRQLVPDLFRQSRQINAAVGHRWKHSSLRDVCEISNDSR